MCVYRDTVNRTPLKNGASCFFWRFLSGTPNMDLGISKPLSASSYHEQTLVAA